MKNRACEPGTVESEIEKVRDRGVKKRLLLHACCGPCASSVLEYLYPFFDITVFFYNPNIMPEAEFNLRLDTLKTLVSNFDGVDLIVPPQDVRDFTTAAAGLETCPEGGERCSVCFSLRLEKTAGYAAAHSGEFDFFATTLTVSPHKNALLINETGRRAAEKSGAKYLASDFKKRNGYLRSIELCREYGLYRQNYCGCRFSVPDRS